MHRRRICLLLLQSTGLTVFVIYHVFESSKTTIYLIYDVVGTPGGRPVLAFLVILISFIDALRFTPPVVPTADDPVTPNAVPLLPLFVPEIRLIALFVLVVLGILRCVGGPNPGTSIPHCFFNTICKSCTSNVLLPRCCANRKLCFVTLSKKSSASCNNC